jgi:hypothetical protein
MKPCPQTEGFRMTDTNSQTRRLALVIDADNAQPSLIQPVLLAAASRGRVTVRRIYGDWTSPNMASWKAHLLDHSIRPLQQFRIVGGKNATDSAMIIDAMDLLHSGLVDGFCIVSSDSDFTSLARRIQESGLFVMGVGRRTTPDRLPARLRGIRVHRRHARHAGFEAGRSAAQAPCCDRCRGCSRLHGPRSRRVARATVSRTHRYSNCWRRASARPPMRKPAGPASAASVRSCASTNRLQQQGLRPRHTVRPAGKPARPVPAAQG